MATVSIPRAAAVSWNPPFYHLKPLTIGRTGEAAAAAAHNVVGSSCHAVRRLQQEEVRQKGHDDRRVTLLPLAA